MYASIDMAKLLIALCLFVRNPDCDQTVQGCNFTKRRPDMKAFRGSQTSHRKAQKTQVLIRIRSGP